MLHISFFIFLVCFIFVYTYILNNNKVVQHLSALAVNELKTNFCTVCSKFTVQMSLIILPYRLVTLYFSLLGQVSILGVKGLFKCIKALIQIIKLIWTCCKYSRWEFDFIFCMCLWLDAFLWNPFSSLSNAETGIMGIKPAKSVTHKPSLVSSEWRHLLTSLQRQWNWLNVSLQVRVETSDKHGVDF